MKEELTLNPDQLKCLSSGLRNRIFATLKRLGEASSSDLARESGMTSEALHYHLKQLERVGLIEVAFRRPAPRKPESVYRASSKNIRLPDAASDPEVARLSRLTILKGLRDVYRGFEAASKASLVDSALSQSVVVHRAMLRLRPADLKKFLAMLEDASRFAQEHSEPEGSSFQWSSLVFPNVK